MPKASCTFTTKTHSMKIRQQEQSVHRSHQGHHSKRFSTLQASGGPTSAGKNVKHTFSYFWRSLRQKKGSRAHASALKNSSNSHELHTNQSVVWLKVAVRRVHPFPLEAEPVGLNGFDDCPRAVGDFDVVAVHALVVELVGLGFPLLGRRSPLVRDNVVIALHYYWSRGTNNRHANGKPERGGVSGVSAVPVFEMVGCRSYIASCD